MTVFSPLACKDAVETGLFRFAGQGTTCSPWMMSLGRRFRSGICGASFSMCSSKRSAQNGSQPAPPSMKPTLSLGVTIEDAFADHVHHGDHQFEREGRHVHVGVFAQALAAGAHDAGNAGARRRGRFADER